MVLVMELAVRARNAPARQALAAAITAHQAAKADRAATLAAAEAADQAVLDARARHDAAEAAAAQAPLDAADHLAAVARGNAGPAPATARERREALLDAEDALIAARSARDLLRERAPTDAQRVELAEGRCKAAALAVLRAEAAPAAAELLDELTRAHEVVARLGRITDWLAGAGVIEAAGPVRTAISRHTTPPCGWGWQDGRSDPAAGWHATLAMLQADADAPSAVVARA